MFFFLKPFSDGTLNFRSSKISRRTSSSISNTLLSWIRNVNYLISFKSSLHIEALDFLGYCFFYHRLKFTNFIKIICKISSSMERSNTAPLAQALCCYIGWCQERKMGIFCNSQGRHSSPVLFYYWTKQTYAYMVTWFFSKLHIYTMEICFCSSIITFTIILKKL